jgi:hypothetical protein
MPLYEPRVPRTLILPPGLVVNAAAAAWPAANRALFGRVDIDVAAPIRYLNWSVGVQSGNIQVGIVALAGTSYTRFAHSGVIACPAVGDVRTDLGAQTLPAGPYAAFIWADNTTFQTRYTTNSGLGPLRVGAVESSLTTGVGASGTLGYSTVCPNLSIEAS